MECPTKKNISQWGEGKQENKAIILVSGDDFTTCHVWNAMQNLDMCQT